MDRFKKFPPGEDPFGRLMRNMSYPGASFQSTTWSAATDIYETERAFVLYMDLAGIDPADVSVVAEEQRVIVSGKRLYPSPDGVKHIHQLEIDRGFFEKSLSLPKPIDVNSTSSIYQHGFLIITMPKQKSKGRVQVEVR